MRLTFLIIVFLMIFGASFCLADEAEKINTEIIQIKMDRFYFASGVEENIFQDCSYIIIKSDDTLYKGHIEASYPGVSYCYQTESISDTFNIDSCRAIIQPARIDSLTPINIGVLKSIPYGSLSNFPGIISVTLSDDSAHIGESKYGNILHTHHYDSETEMLLDFEAGRIDALISYKSNQMLNQNQTIISTPAPFYVAMIPNISKPVNKRAFFTTSLYYRFNAERISTLFDDKDAISQNCLFPYLNDCNRLFEFNPENGRNLLNYMQKKPKKIFIQLQDRSLEKLGQYFADVLSRDRIKTKFTEDSEKADILIEFVPILENNLDSSLKHFLNILNSFLPSMSVSNPIAAIYPELIQYFESAQNAGTEEKENYYLRLAQRTLMEDIGIFPLVRPSLHIISNDNLIGVRFDMSGNLDISNLRKVILPQKLIEVNR